jgi:hypothetical protein
MKRSTSESRRVEYGNSIKEIVARTALPVRLIRYTLEHGLAPVGRNVSRGRGFERWLERDQAYLLALVVSLLHHGVKRHVVEELFRGHHDQDFFALYRELPKCREATLELGNAEYFRVRTERTVSSPLPFENRWRRIEEEETASAAGLEVYEPEVLTRFDLLRLYRRLSG